MKSLARKEGSDRARSRFIRSLVQKTNFQAAGFDSSNKPPMTIVQYWDDPDAIPLDVRECVDSWKIARDQGFEVRLFNRDQAEEFIHKELGTIYRQAFNNCYHPAMQSDYFRLCYIFLEGGCYVDIDDVFTGARLHPFFIDGRLKLHPLCYDTSVDQMVPTARFTPFAANGGGWIFYFNNNPLIAGCRHPLIGQALDQATRHLLAGESIDSMEIQSTTGPGNLTKSIFDAITCNPELEQTLLVMLDWESIAKCRWDLSYRTDRRNWRLSNCQRYLQIESLIE